MKIRDQDKFVPRSVRDPGEEYGLRRARISLINFRPETRMVDTRPVRSMRYNQSDSSSASSPLALDFLSFPPPLVHFLCQRRQNEFEKAIYSYAPRSGAW